MEKWHINKIRLNQGGYDNGGIYWGIGLPLYECWNDEETYHFRATSRQHAFEQLQDMFKGEEIKTYR